MLERNLSKSELTDLLTLNQQEIPSGVDKVKKSIAGYSPIVGLSVFTQGGGGQGSQKSCGRRIHPVFFMWDTVKF